MIVLPIFLKDATMKTKASVVVFAMIGVVWTSVAFGQIPNPREIPWPPKVGGLPTIIPKTTDGRTPAGSGSILEKRGEVELMIVRFRSQQDAETIRAAFWYLLGKWYDEEVIRSASAKVRRNRDVKTGTFDYTYATTEEANQALLFCVVGMKPFGLEPRQPRLSIRITGADISPWAGRGTVGLPTVIGSTYERRLKKVVDFPRYSIEINRDEVARNRDQQLWASVIWHEMLHNIGFDHGTPKNENDLAAYRGYLITEWDEAICPNLGEPLTGGGRRFLLR